MSMTWQFMDSFLKSRAGRRARSGIGSSGRSIRIATGNVCGRMYVWSSRSAVLTSIMHPPGLQRFALTVDRPASAPRADGLRRAYYGPSHGRNAVQLFSIRGGTTIATCCRMHRILGFLAGVLVGQWLVFGGALSPADLHIRASAAWKQRDYPEALRLWSQAVSLQPGNAELHYLRGRALAALGLRASAADAFQVSLLLEPQSTIAREAIDGLAGLQPTAAGDGEVLVPLESGLGVWIVPALVNGHRGRFLLDTGYQGGGCSAARRARRPARPRPRRGRDPRQHFPQSLPGHGRRRPPPARPALPRPLRLNRWGAPKWPPYLPSARRAPAKPWRASTPSARRAPAKPWRASICRPTLSYMGGPVGAPLSQAALITVRSAR